MNDKIVLRPSSLDEFLQCPQKWYQTFILGKSSRTNNRAAIGTAIHAGIEEMWKDSMKAKQKIHSVSSMADAAVEAFEAEEKLEMVYDEGENKNTSLKEVIVGMDTYVSDIVPWSDIPTGVEQVFAVTIDDHPVVAGISGTVDYMHTGLGVIADVKTGKRKHDVANSSTQQSIYKILAEENGVKVKLSTIHNVVLKAKPEGHLMDCSINTDRAKTIVNTLLDTLSIHHKDIVDPDILFRGNPKYWLCSPKYCAFFNECKFVR